MYAVPCPVGLILNHSNQAGFLAMDRRLLVPSQT